MSAIASQITGVSIVYSIVCSGAHQRKYQNSASLAFVRGIHRWPVNSPHKGPVTRKMFPFEAVIMYNDGFFFSLSWSLDNYPDRMTLFKVADEILRCRIVLRELGGGRVTRAPFGPLNVFVYISHCAARVDSQNWLHVEDDYRKLRINARAFLMRSNWWEVEETWKNAYAKLERNTIKFNGYLNWVPPTEKALYGCYWGSAPER